MKRKLSDHDEWALDRLARCTEKPSTSRRTGMPIERRLTSRVWLRDGWGYASDAYRMLCLPVDLDVDGSVSRLDALTGGTVDVERGSDDGDRIVQLARVTPAGGAPEVTLGPRHRDLILPWLDRKMATTCRPTYAVVDPSCAVISANGRFHTVTDTLPSGAGFVLPSVLSLPLLAPIVQAISEAAAGGIWCQPHPHAAVPIYGADPLDGWGLVMPVRWSPRIEWAEA